MRKYKTAKTEDFITDYELMKSLSRFSPIKRKAILFALISGMCPDEIEVLDWDTLREIPLSKDAAKMANALPRHIFSGLVFWEIYDDVPIMISNLKRDCDDVAHPYKWHKLVKLTEDMVPIINTSDGFMRELARQVF